MKKKNKTMQKYSRKFIVVVAVSVAVVAMLTIVVFAQPFSPRQEQADLTAQATGAMQADHQAAQNEDYKSIEAVILTRSEGPFHNGSFTLSEVPGFHDEPFDLVVSIPSIPNVVIYYTIDGNEPQPGEDRYLTRGENSIKVSGSLPENGTIRVEDRSGYWGYAILAYHHTRRFTARHSTLPADGAEILQGTAFRFRGFADGEPVTETVTATYIIAPDAGTRYANRSIVSVTAPYEDLVYIYRHAAAQDPTVRRRIFNYEYFEYGIGGYVPVFNMPGSTSLGGSFSRNYAQRTFNVHLSRDELDGVITHPIFPGLNELYRFRLWNGGQSFRWDHMRDTFAQTASSGLNVLHADNNLAIKFINGEYWGFTTIREHTSNRHFITSRTGIDRRNVALLNVVNCFEDGRVRVWDVSEGPEDVVFALHSKLIEFATSHDMSTDHARERLFNEFICQDNFMDYLIARTFFSNRDWPTNNMRIFRAITPDIDSANPYNDGKWRFILHDMDFAPRPGTRPSATRFPELYEFPSSEDSPGLYEFRQVFYVMNNPAFVEQFRERALYVLDTEFQKDKLLELHSEFVSRYVPLLPEMYNRFAIEETVGRSIRNFNRNVEHLEDFLSNREYYYRWQLDRLVERLR